MNKHPHPHDTLLQQTNKPPLSIACTLTSDHTWLHCQQVDNAKQKNTPINKIKKTLKYLLTHTKNMLKQSETNHNKTH